MKSAVERGAYLDRVCAEDSALRRRVESLLAAHERAASFLEAPVGEKSPESTSPGQALEPIATVPPTIHRPITEGPGTVVGRYKLLQQIGEGGMGVVYMAEQEKPVRRRVALKIIKPGMDSAQVIARFEAERQALAMMDHPNIARVLDAGTTDTGRPYFVMELVQGIPITQYCDDKLLNTTERLELFIQVCNAIQHAHQKGIIHRDLKPSNVLIAIYDGKPVPKIIDFGVAKALHQRLTEKTMFTQFGAVVGTLEYMSPEQADMDLMGTDTRSDIYSLGVLLYELLTGTTPLDGKKLRSLGYAEMLKTIREVEPPKPSTRLSQSREEMGTISARRHTEPKRLQKMIAGDLDWIVMRCLEKDRTRRYETANGLAMDIQRHLNDEAVIASPPGNLYRLQKLVRRNKLLFGAIGCVIAALMLGMIVSTIEAVRATHAEHDAVASQVQAESERQTAVEAQVSEADLRRQADAARVQAEADELAARQRAYASDMNIGEQAMAGGNLGYALDMLNRQRPQPGQKDLRGWEWRYLWQQTRSDALFTLCRKSEIESLAVSADGRWLAIGLVHKGGVSVYDLQTRQQVANLVPDETHERAVFSPTEPLLAFSSADFSDPGKTRSTLHLWNAATQKMVAEFPLDNAEVALAFSQDGLTLLTYTDHITLWRVSDGAKLANYPCPQRIYYFQGTTFAATPDLRLAAYSLSYGQICVIDLRSGRELWVSKPAAELVTALSISPDGKTLASGYGWTPLDIRLWDLATGRETGRLPHQNSWVGSLVFWPDGKKLASCSGDQTIRIWDLASQTCTDVLRGHRLEVMRLALLPDGKTLVSGAKDGEVCLWDTSVTHPRQRQITLPESVGTARGYSIGWHFAPDRQSLLALNTKGQLSRWSGPDFQRKETILAIGTEWNYNLFSRDGRFLVVGSNAGVLKVWDLARRILLHQLTVPAGVACPINLLADGSRLLTSPSYDEALIDTIHEWDLTSGTEIQSWQVPSYSVAWTSPDERYCLAVSDGDGVQRNLADKKSTVFHIDSLEESQGLYSPDGKLLAISSDLGYARVFDAATLRPLVTLPGFFFGVHGAAFSSDGQRLLTCTDGQAGVRLWATDSWQNVLALDGNGISHLMGGGVATSPDGSVVSWLGSDGQLYLWRAPSWAEINAAEKGGNQGP